MKAILQSIKSQYCELIAAGKKTIEVKKSKPNITTPFKVYIYQSTETRLTTAYKKGETTGYKDDDGNDILFDEFVPVRKRTFNQRKVIGEYVCDYIRKYPYVEGEEVGEMYYDITTADGEATGLTYSKFADYGKGKTLYGWHISDLVIYDEPKELNDFAKANFPTYDETEGSLCEYCPVTNFGQDFVNDVPDDFQCDVDCYDAYEEYAAQNRFLTRPPQSWCYVEGI